jgi:hypothetical protein
MNLHPYDTVHHDNTFQLAQMLSAMNPLKFGLGTPFFTTTLFNFCHMTHRTFMSLNYMPHIAIVITL